MKIIAKGKGNTFILEADGNELGNLAGFVDRYRAESSRRRDFACGDEIAVHAMFMRLYTLEDSKGELERLAKQLRAQADLLESVEPVIAAATEEPAP